jgi:beta-galactosidase
MNTRKFEKHERMDNKIRISRLFSFIKMALMKRTVTILFICLLFIRCSDPKFSKRITVSLNGSWEVEESLSADSLPKIFKHKTIVPGLVDMAIPAFDSVGVNYAKRNYFWFRRNFKIDQDYPSVVLLKINKSSFGTKVYLNGNDIGYNPYCFTPSYFDIRKFLKPKGEENEIIIRLGAWLNNLPDSIPGGKDFEKVKYISGIYDDINVILSGSPYIENVQIIPDIDKKQIRVVTEIKSDKAIRNFNLDYAMKEVKSGSSVCSGKSTSINLKEGINKIDFIIPINNCHLWSPEDPFLYQLKLSTGADSKSERFGMRTFHFDKVKKIALLNGKPYAMLGTNICIFRFFEDSARGSLPWQEEWVRKLHHQFKNMNWNCCRYCIGFPPEKWYEIADETGMLIQDEYPLWGQQFKPSVLTEEYTRWMRERWNHPCVVIWDAQNETHTDSTGKAINLVRGLDLSNRPWDNGYASPQSDGDCIESHPYLFVKYCCLFADNAQLPSKRGYMKDLFDTVRIPMNDPNEFHPPLHGLYENAVVVNEYDWLWINRDGSSTVLTDSVYIHLFGEHLTSTQRRIIHAENVAMLTEYWRCHRKCAAVMHFCGLGYSRTSKPRGATSDNFIDINNLTYDPYFFQMVKPKFALICNMINKWEKIYKSGEKLTVPVYIINDQQQNWKGKALFYILQDNKKIEESSKDVSIAANGREIIDYPIAIPEKIGEYKMISEIILNKDTIQSVRKFDVVK